MRYALRALGLAAILAVVLTTLPNSSVRPADTALVKVNRAQGVDLSPDVIWIMAVGSDARPGQSITHSRGDALQLVGINTETGAAAAIGVPRDSWVGGRKINEALYSGGPQGMADAIRGLVGIEADYVFVTGFKGLENMVNAIGGIKVRNPRAFSDDPLKPKGFKKGMIHLGGYDAMAFSRARHELPAGDFDRSANQQRTIIGILHKLRDAGDKPGFIEKGVQSVLRNAAVNASPAEIFQIAQAIRQVNPRKVSHCVVQGGVGYVGAASVVFPDFAQARRFGDDARKDATIKHC